MNGITREQFDKWAGAIFKAPPPSEKRRYCFCTKEYLEVFYNEFGREMFLELVSKCSIVTSEGGIDFIKKIQQNK